jgi:hypothetical protein
MSGWAAITSPTDTACTQMGCVVEDPQNLPNAAELLGYAATVLGDRDELEQDVGRERTIGTTSRDYRAIHGSFTLRPGE